MPLAWDEAEKRVLQLPKNDALSTFMYLYHLYNVIYHWFTPVYHHIFPCSEFLIVSGSVG